MVKVKVKTKKKLLPNMKDVKDENIKENKFAIAKLHYNNIKIIKAFYADLTSEQKTAITFLTNKIHLAFIKHYMLFKNISGFYKKIPFIEYEDVMTSLGYTLHQYRSASINNLKNYIEEFANAQISQVAILDKLFKYMHNTTFNGDMVIYNTTICSEDIKIGDINTQDTYMVASVYKATSDMVLGNIQSKTGKNDHLCVFIITNIKDLPCIYMNLTKDLSDNYIAHDEAEYLLPRGISVKITNIEKHHIDSMNEKSYKKLTKLFEGDEYNEEQYIKYTKQKEYTIYTCEYVNRNMDPQPLAPYVLSNEEMFSIS